MENGTTPLTAKWMQGSSLKMRKKAAIAICAIGLMI
jgi:hypothetical protein